MHFSIKMIQIGVEESIVNALRITDDGLACLTSLFALFMFLLCRLRVVRSQSTLERQL
jgi:hypothetical protein